MCYEKRDPEQAKACFERDQKKLTYCDGCVYQDEPRTEQPCCGCVDGINLRRMNMSLDIRFTTQEGVICPKCGEVIAAKEIDCVDSGGHGWYPILEEIGYYVPYDQRTEKNDWYGKDMVMTAEQTDKVYEFIKTTSGLYDDSAILGLIARAMRDGNSVVVNADW